MSYPIRISIGAGSFPFDFTDELLEQGCVRGIALGMKLDAKYVGMVFQADLLDDAIGGAPCLDFEAIAEAVDGLVMGAVDALETDGGIRGETEGLDVVGFHLGQVVAWNIEMQRAAEGDVEDLGAFADGEDGDAVLEGGLNRGKFETVAVGFGVLFDQRKL